MKIRRAKREDIIQIVAMLADDNLGISRENYKDPLPQSYYDSFIKIDQDPNQYLVVAEADGEIVGTAQLSLIPYLTYQGGMRSQIEAVRIRSDHRGTGLGESLCKWMITQAQEKGAHLIQLTTDKQRPDALRFYEKLGFKATHEGMKMHFRT